MQTVLLSELALHGTRGGDDDRTERDFQSALGCAAVDLAADSVVHRRRCGDHHPGADHRSRSDNRSFVYAGVTADDDVILDNHRHVADRFEHSADLRAGAQMYALA